jgi:DNA polymerase-1
MMPRHKFYLDMERVGFRVDESARHRLHEKYLMMFERIHAANTEILGYDLNVNSNPQVTRCLYEDLKFPYRFKRGTANSAKPLLVADEETITALLGNHAKSAKQKSVAQNILDERKIRKTISTYITAKSDYDGRMRTSYNITGTVTDRTSTSNISAPVRPEKSMGLGFQTLTKHGDIGADICEMFIPDDGYVFLNADLSQAEARVVFVLAQEWETLASLDDPKFDMHWKTAKIFFKELPDVYECKRTLSKEDPRRFIGKTIRHAGHLGAGKHQVMESVNTDAKKYGIDLAISEWKAGQYLESFHAANPNIRNVFHKGVDELVANTRTLVGPRLINPSGNLMRVGRRRQFFERYNAELLKSALADIPQHTISNQTKFAGMRIKQRIPDIRFVLEGHDALLALVPKAETVQYARVFREEMEKPIDFSQCSLPRDYILVVPADFSIGEKNYKDLEKLKGV